MAGSTGRQGRDAPSTEVPLFSEKGCIWNANASQNHTACTLLENANSSLSKTGKKTETSLTGQGCSHCFSGMVTDRVRPLKLGWGMGGSFLALSSVSVFQSFKHLRVSLLLCIPSTFFRLHSRTKQWNLKINFRRLELVHHPRPWKTEEATGAWKPGNDFNASPGWRVHL